VEERESQWLAILGHDPTMTQSEVEYIPRLVGIFVPNPSPLVLYQVSHMLDQGGYFFR
jgi:hypothetical protein